MRRRRLQAGGLTPNYEYLQRDVDLLLAVRLVEPDHLAGYRITALGAEVLTRLADDGAG